MMIEKKGAVFIHLPTSHFSTSFQVHFRRSLRYLKFVMAAKRVSSMEVVSSRVQKR